MKKALQFIQSVCLILILSGQISAQNQALAMDDVNDYVELSQWATDLIFDAPATVEFWLKANFDHRASPADETHCGVVFSIGTGDPDEEYFILYYGNCTNGATNELISLIHSEEGAGNYSFNSYTEVANIADQWHHYAIVCTGMEWNVYRNGVLQSAIVHNGNNNFIGDFGENIFPKQKASIGTDLIFNNSWLNGSLDEFRLWNTARTASEIADNYNKTFNCPQPGLVAYYKFDELQDLEQGNPGVNDVADFSGNGFHGDVIGGATTTTDAPLLQTDEDCDGFFTPDDCNDANFNINPSVTEVCNGIDDDCNGLADEDCGPQLTVDAGECQVVYFGYGLLACTTLNAVASGGTFPYSFAWSNGMTGASIQICPSTSQTYTVTVTDNGGITAADGVTVEVVDVHCGNNNNKVLLCHNGSNTLCVSPNAVPAHLGHGDYLGVCGTEPCSSSTESRIENTPSVNHPALSGARMVCYPNPTSKEINVLITGDVPEASVFEVADFAGKTVRRTDIQPMPDILTLLNVADLSPGLYLLRWSFDGKILAVKTFNVIQE